MKLTVKGIANVGPGVHSDGGGLSLKVQKSGARSWVYRYQMNKRRRDLGLGPYPSVTLSDARAKADEARAKVRAGIDPMDEASGIDDRPQIDPTLNAVFAETLDIIRDDLKNPKAVESWKSPLEVHLLPKLGHRDVTTFTQHTIADALRPIWKTKPETARKALARLFKTLRKAKSLGLDVGNLTELRADVRDILGQQPGGKNMPSMPYADVPDLYAELAHNDGTGALALRLLILTGTRSGPVRLARFEQFDLDGHQWTVPAAHMKGRKDKTADFRVPLSGEAVAVVRLAAERDISRTGFLFAGMTGKPISDMTMTKFLADRDIAARPHGFRASLRTWLAERTDAPWEVAETVLQHVVGNRVERAYQRSDFFDQRRPFMDAWAAHCTGETFDPVAAEREALQRRLAELGAAS